MAMAPQQLGIGIRRHFTDTGGRPVRHASSGSAATPRIPNFKDGGDAFFQPDVEFPTDWSLNATNIVAQKYFRGTLGTPEREWSLRQVIDRVVDTIARLGRARRLLRRRRRSARPSATSSSTCSCTSAPRSTRRCGSTSA